MNIILIGGAKINLLEYLGIKVEQADSQKTILSLTVTDELKQPHGLVHGGINAVLAESAASIAANCLAGPDQAAVGVSINVNHLIAVRDGQLKAVAQPIRIGKRLQVWEVTIFQYPSEKKTAYATVTTMLQHK